MKKYLNTPLDWIVLTLFIIGLIFSLSIYFCSDEIVKYSIRPDYIGFSNFEIFFSFPIKLFVGATTLLGINIAYKKYIQDSKNFKEQFELQSTNIKINNYYRHMDQFIISAEFLIGDIIENESLKPLFPKSLRNESTLKDYDNFVRQKITKNFASNIHRIWFGTVYDSNLHIKDYILLKIQQLYDTYIGSTENNSIKPLIKDLGLNRVLLNTNSETSNIYFYIMFRLCKHILDFDNKHIKNESKLYECIGI